MVVMMERERWTDERLDKAFDRIDAEIRELRVEMKRGFERVGDRFNAMQSEMNLRFESMQSEMNARFESVQSETNARFDSMNQRFDSMQRTMIIGFVTLFASIVASMIGTAILA
jgi:hypothetical protein